MKIRRILIMLLCLTLIPMSVFADDKKDIKDGTTSMNLKEVLADEGIEPAFSNYKENDKQITIYLFRGKGCTYCHKFLEYINSITEEYGKYFKLESYEVWANKANSDLWNEIATFLGQPAEGVPYIIIGNKVIPGFSEAHEEEIKKAIKDEYDNKERYNLFEEMKNAPKESETNNNSGSVVNSILIVISTISILLFVYNRDKKLNMRLDEIEKNMKVSSKKSK